MTTLQSVIILSFSDIYDTSDPHFFQFRCDLERSTRSTLFPIIAGMVPPPSNQRRKYYGQAGAHHESALGTTNNKTVQTERIQSCTYLGALFGKYYSGKRKYFCVQVCYCCCCSTAVVAGEGPQECEKGECDIESVHGTAEMISHCCHHRFHYVGMSSRN